MLSFLNFFNNIFLLNLVCILLIITTFFVLITKNKIYSIFFLILSFLNSANFLILNNIEYLAFVFIVIYVGALAILFLFVIMFLNIKTINISNATNNLDFLFLSFLLIILILIFKLTSNYDTPCLLYLTSYDIIYLKTINWSLKFINGNIFIVLGSYLFYYNIINIILSSFILFIPMIGTIILNMKQKYNNKYKKQSFHLQVNCNLKYLVKKKSIIFKE